MVIYNSKIISTNRLRGCLIALNGVSYRLIHIHRKAPPGIVRGKCIFSAELLCKSGHHQNSCVFKHCGRTYLSLFHPWLQHGYKGVIHTYAEIERVGDFSGPDGWLRVPLNFPDIPCAELAIRVAVPWPKRRLPAPLRPFVPGIAPVTPLDSEDLFLILPEVEQ